MGTRVSRDKIFENENPEIFLENLYSYFKKFKKKNNILYVEGDDDAVIQEIIARVKILK